MGRNILSICDECKEYIFHLRGRESNLMQKFQNLHADHEKRTRIISDYVEEQPDNYLDVTDDITDNFTLADIKRHKKNKQLMMYLLIMIRFKAQNTNLNKP